MRSMFKEFKAFALKGNVIDLAVGIIIGGAFGTIVSSLVKDVLMPPLGLLLGKVDFSNLFLVLSPAKDGSTNFLTIAKAQELGAVTLNYGLFLNAVVNFLILAGAIFLLVRSINKIHNLQSAPTTKDCPHCKMAIPLEASKCGHCTSQL